MCRTPYHYQFLMAYMANYDTIRITARVDIERRKWRCDSLTDTEIPQSRTNATNNAAINNKMTQRTKMKLGLLRFRQLNDAIVHSGVPLYCVWQKLCVWASRMSRGSNFAINWHTHSHCPLSFHQHDYIILHIKWHKIYITLSYSHT